MLPFGNVIVVKRFNGSELVKALTRGLGQPSQISGAYLMVRPLTPGLLMCAA